MFEFWTAVFAAGTAIFSGAMAYVLFERLFRSRLDLNKILRSPLQNVREVQRFSAVFREEDYRSVALGGLAGVLLGLLVDWGSTQTFSICLVSSGIGAGLGWFVQKGLRDTARMRRLRQVAAIYEAVDFYTRAGYTVRQSLALAAVLAPDLRRAVERCLAAWPSGPVNALERFAEEIDLPEAALLSSVLAHAEEAGVSFGRSAIEEESRNLEALRQVLAELKIVSKPLYFAIYRALPLAAAGGLVAGPLVYRILKLLGSFFGFS